MDLSITISGHEKPTSLRDLLTKNFLVVDFWTTRCTRCPAALTKLNEFALSKKNNGAAVSFVTVNLDGDGGKGLMADDWPDLPHAYVDDFETKEAFKAAFDFASVPLLVVLSSDGAVAYNGKCDIAKLEEIVQAEDKENTFSLNEDF